MTSQQQQQQQPSPADSLSSSRQGLAVYWDMDLIPPWQGDPSQLIQRIKTSLLQKAPHCFVQSFHVYSSCDLTRRVRQDLQIAGCRLIEGLRGCCNDCAEPTLLIDAMNAAASKLIICLIVPADNLGYKYLRHALLDDQVRQKQLMMCIHEIGDDALLEVKMEGRQQLVASHCQSFRPPPAPLPRPEEGCIKPADVRIGESTEQQQPAPPAEISPPEVGAPVESVISESSNMMSGRNQVDLPPPADATQQDMVASSHVDDVQARGGSGVVDNGCGNQMNARSDMQHPVTSAVPGGVDQVDLVPAHASQPVQVKEMVIDYAQAASSDGSEGAGYYGCSTTNQKTAARTTIEPCNPLQSDSENQVTGALLTGDGDSAPMMVAASNGGKTWERHVELLVCTMQSGGQFFEDGSVSASKSVVCEQLLNSLLFESTEHVCEFLKRAVAENVVREQLNGGDSVLTLGRVNQRPSSDAESDVGLLREVIQSRGHGSLCVLKSVVCEQLVFRKDSRFFQRKDVIRDFLKKAVESKLIFELRDGSNNTYLSLCAPKQAVVAGGNIKACDSRDIALIAEILEARGHTDKHGTAYVLKSVVCEQLVQKTHTRFYRRKDNVREFLKDAVSTKLLVERLVGSDAVLSMPSDTSDSKAELVSSRQSKDMELLVDLIRSKGRPDSSGTVSVFKSVLCEQLLASRSGFRFQGRKDSVHAFLRKAVAASVVREHVVGRNAVLSLCKQKEVDAFSNRIKDFGDFKLLVDIIRNRGREDADGVTSVMKSVVFDQLLAKNGSPFYKQKDVVRDYVTQALEASVAVERVVGSSLFLSIWTRKPSGTARTTSKGSSECCKARAEEQLLPSSDAKEEEEVCGQSTGPPVVEQLPPSCDPLEENCGQSNHVAESVNTGSVDDTSYEVQSLEPAVGTEEEWTGDVALLTEIICTSGSLDFDGIPFALRSVVTDQLLRSGKSRFHGNKGVVRNFLKTAVAENEVFERHIQGNAVLCLSVIDAVHGTDGRSTQEFEVRPPQHLRHGDAGGTASLETGSHPRPMRGDHSLVESKEATPMPCGACAGVGSNPPISGSGQPFCEECNAFLAQWSADDRQNAVDKVVEMLRSVAKYDECYIPENTFRKWLMLRWPEQCQSRAHAFFWLKETSDRLLAVTYKQPTTKTKIVCLSEMHLHAISPFPCDNMETSAEEAYVEALLRKNHGWMPRIQIIAGLKASFERMKTSPSMRNKVILNGSKNERFFLAKNPYAQVVGLTYQEALSALESIGCHS